MDKFKDVPRKTVFIFVAVILFVFSIGFWAGYEHRTNKFQEDIEKAFSSNEDDFSDFSVSPNDDEENQNDGTELPITRESALENFGGIDSTIEYNDWNVTLKDIEIHTSIGDESPRGKFVVIIVEAENAGNTERSLVGGSKSWYFLDAENDREYSYSGDGSLEYHQEFNTDTWYLEDIGPGFSGTIPIVFDIPEDINWGLSVIATSSSDISDVFVLDLE